MPKNIRAPTPKWSHLPINTTSRKPIYSGRVLSSGGIERLRELEETRTPMYESFAQCIVEHNRNAPETVAAILEDFEATLL